MFYNFTPLSLFTTGGAANMECEILHWSLNSKYIYRVSYNWKSRKEWGLHGESVAAEGDSEI